MGKSKKRIFNKNTEKKGSVLKRQDVINKVLSDIKNNKLTDEAKNFIGLFGITSEELTEAGAAYEELSAVRHLVH